MPKTRKTKREITAATKEVYNRFIDWMKQTWYGLPEADEMIPFIMALYTPEEASLLTGMPFGGKNLEELAQMKQMDPAQLSQQLDALAKKGFVFRSVKGDTVRYSLNDAFFTQRTTFWPGRKDEVSKTLAPLANQYYYHGFFDPYAEVNTKGLRALPIKGTVEDTREILPYEEVTKVLDSQDYFTVTTCPCKHRKNLDPDFPDCKYPTEVCLHFGRLGHYIVDNGLGREITRHEAEQILRQCAEVGLVHAISNQQEGVDTICNCCKCCCIWFEAFYKLGHSMSLTPSNYRVRTNSETCIGCGLCVKRCPMEALHLDNLPEAKGRVTVVASEKEGKKELKNKTGKVSAANPDLCIGCGVCAYKCQTKSLTLERREVILYPPQTGRDYVMQFIAERQAVQAHPEQQR
jgi:NAD-dependent dihydropyrimidine dehydrogenase PreA subunit/predicted transcriptional regulator